MLNETAENRAGVLVYVIQSTHSVKNTEYRTEFLQSRKNSLKIAEIDEKYVRKNVCANAHIKQKHRLHIHKAQKYGIILYEKRKRVWILL